jgi:hypothetical protein
MAANTELSRKNFWIIALNSTAGFILAYLLLFYMNHISVIGTAGMFDYSISFDYKTILFHIEPYEWTHDAVKLMFSAGPILIFIFGLISLIAYFSLFEELAPVKIFFLWFSFLALNFFFGGLMIGNIFKKGVGHVFSWMYMNDTQKMIIAIIGFFGLLSTGIFMAKPVAHSANTYFKELGEDNFPFFFTAQVIVPFVIGNIFMFSYFFPDIFFNPDILFYERFGWISLLLIFILIFGRINHFDTIYYDEEDRSIRISFTLVISALVLLLGLRLLLHNMILITW